MTHSYVRHDSFICVIWLIHLWQLLIVTWLLARLIRVTMTRSKTHSRHNCDITVTSQWLATRLIHVTIMTSLWSHNNSRQDSFTSQLWRHYDVTIESRDVNRDVTIMTSPLRRNDSWQDSFTSQLSAWLLARCDWQQNSFTSQLLRVMSHMSHVTHMNESCHTYEWVTSRIWMGHVTSMSGSCHTYEWVMSHIWMGHVTHMN